MEPQKNEPVQSSKNIWTALISIIVTALVIGSALLAWQKNQSDMLNQNIQSLATQNENLKVQNDKLDNDLAIASDTINKLLSEAKIEIASSSIIASSTDINMETVATTTKSIINDYTYAIELTDKNTYDNMIVRISKSTGKKDVLLASVKQAAGLTTRNETLAEFSIPENSDKIFLKQGLADTDNAAGKLWSFDVNTKKLTKLVRVNEAYEGFGGVALSPDKLYLAQAPDDESKDDMGVSQKIKLLDLSDDSVATLVTLSGNETLNAGYGALSNIFEIKWLDNETLQYAVYDQSKAKNTGEKKPLIARRIVAVHRK